MSLQVRSVHIEGEKSCRHLRSEGVQLVEEFVARDKYPKADSWS